MKPRAPSYARADGLAPSMEELLAAAREKGREEQAALAAAQEPPPQPAAPRARRWCPDSIDAARKDHFAFGWFRSQEFARARRARASRLGP